MFQVDIDLRRRHLIGPMASFLAFENVCQNKFEIWAVKISFSQTIIKNAVHKLGYKFVSDIINVNSSCANRHRFKYKC